MRQIDTLSDLNNSLPKAQARDISKGGMFFRREEVAIFSSAVKLLAIALSMIISPPEKSLSFIVTILLPISLTVSKSQYLVIEDIRPERRFDAFIIASGSSGNRDKAIILAAAIGKASIGTSLWNVIRSVEVVTLARAKCSRLFSSL